MRIRANFALINSALIYSLKVVDILQSDKCPRFYFVKEVKRLTFPSYFHSAKVCKPLKCSFIVNFKQYLKCTNFCEEKFSRISRILPKALLCENKSSRNVPLKRLVSEGVARKAHFCLCLCVYNAMLLWVLFLVKFSSI